ncbi:hypothetical protein HCH_06065 [Hahella chejuensis KCTC 2396]|uniref:Uncharacterized protein n=1 Tax=Hahella chejuensis (strain KCTC 2396) TaxID=349521 RepID=Q2S9G0_HAHCH|nr:hypothetical protein HCH_06065 [Hahella chejuensis KCTC 2396]
MTPIATAAYSPGPPASLSLSGTKRKHGAPREKYLYSNDIGMLIIRRMNAPARRPAAGDRA